MAEDKFTEEDKPRDYDELLAAVCEGLASGELADVRRLLIRKREKANDSEERGALLGFETACLWHGDPEAARQQLLDLTAREAVDETLLSGCGCSISDVGETRGDPRFFEMAALVFSTANLSAPSWRFIANHAVVLERLEEWEAAAEHFATAAAFARADPVLHVRRAACLRDAGRLDEARDAYLTYLTARPDDAHEWISLAIVECDAGRYDDAEKAFWRAGGLEPDNVSLHYNWFITALRCGKQAMAQDACKRLNAIDRSDWRSGLATARLMSSAGDSDRAFSQAVDIFEREADASEVADDEERSRLEHIAVVALHIAESADYSKAEALVSRLCKHWILPDDVLAIIRKHESPELEELADFFVMLEALSTSSEPEAYLVRYTILADTAREAGELAIAFEQRCGAREARVIEVELATDDRRPSHRGPAWRANRVHGFPADEYGTD